MTQLEQAIETVKNAGYTVVENGRTKILTASNILDDTTIAHVPYAVLKESTVSHLARMLAHELETIAIFTDTPAYGRGRRLSIALKVILPKEAP